MKPTKAVIKSNTKKTIYTKKNKTKQNFNSLLTTWRWQHATNYLYTYNITTKNTLNYIDNE